jgi:hypothetical protein
MVALEITFERFFCEDEEIFFDHDLSDNKRRGAMRDWGYRFALPKSVRPWSRPSCLKAQGKRNFSPLPIVIFERFCTSFFCS